jgi:hypothetical protein
LKKYRRVEINAYRRRVTIVSGVSGEWPCDSFDVQPAETADEVLGDASDACEPVEPDSPEGQLILVEAVRSLEQRLSPEARALIRAAQETSTSNGRIRSALYIKWRSIYDAIHNVRFTRKEKRNAAAKQSIEY